MGAHIRQTFVPHFRRGTILVLPGMAEVVSHLLHHRVDPSSGRDHDDIEVRRRWNKLLDYERALELDRWVVSVLPYTKAAGRERLGLVATMEIA